MVCPSCEMRTFVDRFSFEPCPACGSDKTANQEIGRSVSSENSFSTIQLKTEADSNRETVIEKPITEIDEDEIFKIGLFLVVLVLCILGIVQICNWVF